MLKKALAYDGLARGLHEAARAIERDEAKVGSMLIDTRLMLQRPPAFWCVQLMALRA